MSKELDVVKIKKNNLAIALNQAIIMLEGYNNMYGDKTCKTKEINALDEILQNNK